MVISASSVSIESGTPATKDAIAEPKPRPKLSRCVRYNQKLGSDKQSVDIKLRNKCRTPVACSVEWKVSCDGDTEEPREFADVLKLEKGKSDTLNASAAACGDEGWAVDDIKWECERL